MRSILIKNGNLYIDTYFSEGRIQHGDQYRYYANGQLQWRSAYNHGLIISQSCFDQTGKPNPCK